MNKKFLYSVMLFALAMLAAAPTIALAAVKLPYQKGQEFVVVQGYDSPPTHIKKDAYAIDFSQNGCDAYGKLAVASAAGVVELAQENGYNGGYGTQVLIDEGNHIVARYAHMIPGTIPFAVGAAVVQGQPVGAIGNTGLVAGTACPIHPGTHIHFAMYYQNADGTFAAVSPEPISGYRDITEGHWYLSDNGIEGAASASDNSGANLSANVSAIVGNPTATTFLSPSVASTSLPAAIATITTTTITVPNTTAVTSSANNSGVNGAGGNGGGVVVTQPQPQQQPESPAPAPVAATSSTTSTVSAASTTPLYAISFDSSSLAIDLSWQVATSSSPAGTATYVIYKTDPANASDTTFIATTTATSYAYALAPGDFGIANYFVIYLLNADGSIATGTGSTIAFASTTAPAWFTTIQPTDAENSNGSWYSDNWYDLGAGFYGLIRSLTLEGFINSSDYFASHLYLDEYLDPNYTELNQTWTISDSAPFTDAPQKITIGGLAIPLQPNKYYRLRTYQDYQNRSVILAGTSATGTAMWDEYILNVGIVRNYYSFYPYLAAVMIPNYPSLAAPNPPPNVTTSFDTLNSILNFSWSPATDPDTTSSLLTYEWNVTPSTVGSAAPAFDPAAWQSVGKNFSATTSVIFGNSYTIGVRAVDDLGNIGEPLVVQWNFPPGYYPAPQQLDHSAVLQGGIGSAQKVAFAATTTISGIELWTAPGGGLRCCTQTLVSIRGDASGTPGSIIASSNPIEISSFAPDEAWFYSFNNPPMLAPGVYWLSVDDGPDQLNDIAIFGSAGDSYPAGVWSTAPGQDAYFRIAE